MRIKFLPCILLAGVLAFGMTGCKQVTDVFDEIVDTSDSSNSAVNTASVGEAGVSVTADNGKKVDRNLPVPIFSSYSGGSATISKGTKIEIDATATSTDGGTISYQWYVNNVNSNGGGTAIKDATDAVYVPDTSEESVKYYYVVAKNEHESAYSMATSSVYEVVVIKDGTFTTDEFGGIRYLADDGTYPVDEWVQIDGDTYLFNADGYVSIGWIDMGGGLVYYFDETGKLLRDTVTPDGAYVNADGIRETEPNVVEQPAEAQPAEEQPAEAAEEETQPAEEAVVEAQPAEEQPVE